MKSAHPGAKFWADSERTFSAAFYPLPGSQIAAKSSCWVQRTMREDHMSDESKLSETPVLTRRGPVPITQELRESLGPPPLYKGESEAEYTHFYERLRSDVVPRDVVEEFYVRDIADYFWEVRRLRRIKAKLLETSRAAGLWRVLNNLEPLVQTRMKLHSEWTKGDEKAKQEIDSVLSKAGLDDSAIEAHTFIALSRQLEQIDKAILAFDGRLISLLREVDRHRSTLGLRLSAAISQVEDAEFEEVSTPQDEAA